MNATSTSTTSSATTPGASAPLRAARRIDLRDFGILGGLVFIVVYLSLATSTFLTGQNLVNLLDQVAVVGLLAIGATLCIISGAFDLSCTANLACSAIVGVLATQMLGTVGGFLVALVTGTVLGTLTGLAIVLTRVNSFIGSLAISIIYRGLAVVITGGMIVSLPPEDRAAVQAWASPKIGGLTGSTVLFVVFAVVFGFVLWGTTFGRRIYAVGGNAEAARLSGIRTPAVRVAAFAVSGLCAAAAGMVLVARAGSAQPALATGTELTAIAAVVIGGTSILGGAGAMWRTVVGVAVLTVIGNGFNLLRWDTTYQQVVTGSLILLAVAADSWLSWGSRRGRG